jgi:hypothetical protein
VWAASGFQGRDLFFLILSDLTKLQRQSMPNMLSLTGLIFAFAGCYTTKQILRKLEENYCNE